MAIYRQVYITFWQDLFIMELTPEEKYFYLYLMTNSKTKQCGCYELPKKIMEFETGYNRETVDKLLARFIEYGKIKYDENTNEILLINWHKYNSYTSPKIKACVIKELKEVKNRDFKRYCMDTLSYSIDTDPQQEQTPTQTEEQAEDKFSDDSLEMKMTKYMIKRILENYSAAKIPDTPTQLQKWCLTFDRLMRIDKKTKAEIGEIMEWIYQDEFWCDQIRSPDKLREKWDTVYLQMKRKSKTDPPMKYL
jgi:hypothetical protein